MQTGQLLEILTILGDLITGNNVITVSGKSDINGTLAISNSGIYDTDGQLDATGGAIDQDGTSKF